MISGQGIAQPSADPLVDRTLIPYSSSANSVKLADGRELHLVCMGHGSPTVIFTAGQLGWSGAWSRVQPDVAKRTRTCAWDRPGFGLSDGTATKPTVATTTADLAAALSLGHIRGPYILVAHSMGSFETLMFADRFPRDVVGMILVDPSPPDQSGRAKRLRETMHFQPPEPAAGAQAPPSLAEAWRNCAAEVRAGTLTMDGPDASGCLAFLQPPMPLRLRTAVKRKLATSPAQFETMASFQADSLDEGSKIVVNPSRSYGDIPLIVLTATAWPQGARPEQRAFVEAMMADSDRAHDELAALSTRGVNIRVPDAGHDIQDQKPQAVIDAIDQVIDVARATSRRR